MKRSLALLALIFSALSCYIYYDPYYYAYGYYDPYYYGYDGYLVYVSVDPHDSFYLSSSPPGPPVLSDLNTSAADMASRSGQTFQPGGCATATASGATVTYTFNDCAGHFGIGSISGTTAITLSQDNGELVLTGNSSDLSVDGKPSVLDFTAIVTEDGHRRTARITSNTRRPDQVDSRHSEGTISWTQGSGCIEVSGHGTSTRGPLSVTSSIDALQRCEATCPTGTVTVKGGDSVFSARFNGSSAETVSDPGGRSRNYSIDCR